MSRTSCRPQYQLPVAPVMPRETNSDVPSTKGRAIGPDTEPRGHLPPRDASERCDPTAGVERVVPDEFHQIWQRHLRPPQLLAAVRDPT